VQDFDDAKRHFPEWQYLGSTQKKCEGFNARARDGKHFQNCQTEFSDTKRAFASETQMCKSPTFSVILFSTPLCGLLTKTIIKHSRLGRCACEVPDRT
jgi:hypothetical protein